MRKRRDAKRTHTYNVYGVRLDREGMPTDRWIRKQVRLDPRSTDEQIRKAVGYRLAIYVDWEGEDAFEWADVHYAKSGRLAGYLSKVD